jgi:beta-phosphoglucomutase-like phosphatase (HAD superfamily)
VIECILFDSDGTLVDSEPLSFVVLADMLAPCGPDLDADALHLQFRGWKMGEVMTLLAKEHGLDLPAGFEADFRARQARQFDTDLQAIPGVAPHFGDNIYSAYEVGVWKPDPGIYRHAARDMGFDIGRCLAVEDSPIGLEAAATCGAVPVFLNRYADEVRYDNVIEIGAMAELADVLARL